MPRYKRGTKHIYNTRNNDIPDSPTLNKSCSLKDAKLIIWYEYLQNIYMIKTVGENGRELAKIYVHTNIYIKE